MLHAWCPSPCLLLPTPCCQQAEQPSKRDGHSLSIPLGEGTVCSMCLAFKLPLGTELGYACWSGLEGSALSRGGQQTPRVTQQVAGERGSWMEIAIA